MTTEQIKARMRGFCSRYFRSDTVRDDDDIFALGHVSSLFAMQKLAEFGLRDYFLYPQVKWNSKRSSIELIAQSLNISRESLAFVDDDPFERDEVSFSYPEVLCVDAKDVSRLTQLPEMSPDFITDESRQRRALYLSDHERRKAEEVFTGPKEDFLSRAASSRAARARSCSTSSFAGPKSGASCCVRSSSRTAGIG